MSLLRRLLRDERGATAIEYGLIAAIIGAALIVGVGAVGTGLQNTFQTVSDNISGTE